MNLAISEWEKGVNLTNLNITTFPLNSVSRHLIAENLPSGTYTLSLNLNTWAHGSQYIVYINDNSVGTYDNGSSATFTSNEYINSIKIYSNDNLATSSQVMLNEGSHAYPYQEYNQSAHITNDEATLLKQEWEKGLNLCYKFETGNYRIYVYANLKPNTTYYFSCTPRIQVPNIWIKDLNGNTLQTLWTGDYNKYTDGYTFTTNSSVNGNVLIENGVNAQTITPSNVMLVEGNHAYPYQPYSGPIVHWNKVPFESIVDKQGNRRFIEGNISSTYDTSIITADYAKWSLSGTHLMIVFAGTMAANATLPQWTGNFNFTLPDFIWNKIFPITGDIIGVNKTNFYFSNGANFGVVNEISGRLAKNTSSHTITFAFINDIPTYQYARGFRVQFDLLIDAE